MKRLLLVLALCAISTAFAPRERRAVNEEEEGALVSSSTAAPSTTTTKIICDPDTPCAWTTYKEVTRIIETHIVNDYCICSADTMCKATEDNKSQKVYTYNCRSPDFDDSEILNS